MTGKRILGMAVGASLLLAATACGDDDGDDTAAGTTTTEAQGPTSVEVTLTDEGIDGLPSELPAGLVEITVVNETDDFASLDISRVTEGTTEDEFVEGLAPVFEGGAFPDFFESNVGVEADGGETLTSLVVLREGEHIAWYEGPAAEGEGDEGDEAPTETVTETETETPAESDDTSTTVADDDGTTTSTTAVEEAPSTTVAGEEEGAAGTGQPVGTLTAVAAEDEPADTTDDTADDDGAEEDEEDDDPAEGSGEDEAPGAPEIFTASLTVTTGDDSAELPAADGEIVATDYSFEATLEGPGTINFRNDGPQQFHHAVMMDFGTNDPEAVAEAFPAILESEGDPSSLPEAGDVDMDQVDFEFGGSGVFGPDGASGTFEADIVEGNTYVLACFIQDREGGPPHAIAYDMWEVVQAGGGADSTTTTTDG